MLVKVSELKGRALNYAVALIEWGKPIEGEMFNCSKWQKGDMTYEMVMMWKPIYAVLREEFNPSGNWAHGGPLIDKYNIWLMSTKRDVTDHTWWRAYPLGGETNQNLTAYHRPLRAAMISLVWFKHGSDEIEIPEVLMG